MLENMTTGEKVIAGATAVGIAALIFHKPTRNAVGLSENHGLSERIKSKKKYYLIESKTSDSPIISLTQYIASTEKEAIEKWRNYKTKIDGHQKHKLLSIKSSKTKRKNLKVR